MNGIPTNCPECQHNLTIEKTDFFYTAACENCLGYWRVFDLETCCRNPDFYKVKLITANGTIQVREQCRNCGTLKPNNIGGLTKEQREALPPVDQEGRENRSQDLSDAYRAFYARKQELFEERRQQANKNWWAQYNAYLQSPEWKAKRELILKRDNNTCQACLKNRADQVHHRSYEFVDFTGREPCFDLISICTQCHQRLHEIRNKRKAS